MAEPATCSFAKRDPTSAGSAALVGTPFHVSLGACRTVTHFHSMHGRWPSISTHNMSDVVKAAQRDVNSGQGLQGSSPFFQGDQLVRLLDGAPSQQGRCHVLEMATGFAGEQASQQLCHR